MRRASNTKIHRQNHIRKGPRSQVHITQSTPETSTTSTTTAPKSDDNVYLKMSIFHHFARLPKELHLKIWARTLPRFPRIIETEPTYKIIHDPNVPLGVKTAVTVLEVACKAPPTLLQIDQESRSELRRNCYSPFNSNISPNINSLLINYDSDTLFVHVENKHHRLHCAEGATFTGGLGSS